MPQRYRPQEAIKVLERLGWRVIRVRGDHARLVREGGKSPVTVPALRRELSASLFGDILRQAGLSKREFESSAEEVL